MEYANEISNLNTNYDEKNLSENNLLKINLMLNKKKAEKLQVTAEKDDWKICKFLGSYIDTETDIKSRKGKLLAAAIILCDVFENSKITIKKKLQVFRTYLKQYFFATVKYGH